MLLVCSFLMIFYKHISVHISIYPNIHKYKHIHTYVNTYVYTHRWLWDIQRCTNTIPKVDAKEVDFAAEGYEKGTNGCVCVYVCMCMCMCIVYVYICCQHQTQTHKHTYIGILKHMSGLGLKDLMPEAPSICKHVYICIYICMYIYISYIIYIACECRNIHT